MPKGQGTGIRNPRAAFVSGLAIATLLAGLVGVVAFTPPAGADVVIDGCTIVANPTPTSHSKCPGADLAGADLATANLS